MNEYGIVAAPQTVRIERLLPGPVERVWAYLTNSDKRGTWLASGAMELSVGGRVELNFNHSDLSADKKPPEKYKRLEKPVSHTGHVTRIERERLISYTWNEHDGVSSEVTFELTPRGDKVLLVVTHSRLASRSDMVSVASGWHTHLGILMDQLEDREPRPFWTTLTELEKQYEERIS